MTVLSDLPKRLEDAGYVRDFLSQVGAVTAAHESVDPTALEALTRQPTPASTLGKVFFMARRVPQAELEAALTQPLCQLLLQEGLLVDAGGRQLQASYAIVPARGFWGLRDFDAWATGRPLATDHVLGAGIASALLADLTVRRKEERVLDLGTGQGFQAAMAARHAAHVVGTDINPRALRLAALAMRLNGIEHVEFRAGSMFAPVANEKFDLLVSNPPFVIAPPHDLTVMGGRWVGDSFVEQLVTRAPEFLNEGGWATVIANWHHPNAADWAARPTAWISGRGVDAWIVKWQTDDPGTYAENWLRERATTGGTYAMADARRQLPEWLEYYRSLNIGAISMGAIYLRKRTANGTAPGNWVRNDSLELQHVGGPAGAQVQRLFAGETHLRSLRSEAEILDFRLALSDTSAMEQHFRPVAGQLQMQQAHIRQTQGFGFPMALGPVPTAILTVLTPQRLARDAVRDLALEMKADPAIAYEKSWPFLAEMVRMTHVTIAGA
jgi:methylase of polypeptide subunit release factors